MVLGILCLAPPVFPLGRRDKPGPDNRKALETGPAPPSPAVPGISGPGGAFIRDGDQVELEGRVRLVGSEPFPELVLTGADGVDWYLEGPARQALQPYEQRIVRVRGRAELREMILANGRSLGFRPYLLEAEPAEKQGSPD
jgi:hypothetical protein